ncbi:maleylpyruvate isomerase family mycothiol-dependent enzyme [Streptomyces sp. I6]|uniref:maleylpyruvate isomerase family mycothiol-dependent enzyme n=1 Tax=Streptomyces sp. I6 TaxID=2483113 RepID=UPI000F4588EE|nr:maleylpyruvate isomerase family mycothiol-dependent enzyme [Streptomyces sp. I6]RNL70220.1 maleylpyruvate isomerase family mycothiol-dependent enzyme [Streptomyces sp. I6]
METSEFIAHLDEEGRLLAEAAASAGPDAVVPTCPGWRIRDLLRHTGTVHRWAAAVVTERHAEYRPAAGEPDLDGAALLTWFREGHGLLVDALSKAPAGLDCWTFLPAASPLVFWARRQTHETAVHRADAESALGEPGPVPQRLAADGVDELLCAFHGRRGSRVRTGAPKVLRVRSTDTGDVWTVRLSAEPPRADRSSEGPADCELSGPAGRLHLVLWNRLPLSAVALDGEGDVARLWRETSAITWA